MPPNDGRFPLRCRSRVALFLFFLLAACADGSSSAGPPPPVGDKADTAFFVTSNGWHSGIAVARTDLTPGLIPETADFTAARFFEFGWGDAAYYPARETTLGMTLSAALIPTPAVVHLVALDRHPADAFRQAEVVALSVDDPAFGRLLAYIDASFDRAGAPRAASVGPGLYANSRFYPATGRFHLFNTCNTWTARALATAGFAIEPGGAARAEDLMEKVRSLGAVK